MLITKVAWVKEEKPVIKTFSEQDARQLLEYYDNKSYMSCRNRTIITMIFETGIRCKELLDMQPEDIKENYILIHGKNHKERLVSLTLYISKCAIFRQPLFFVLVLSYIKMHISLYGGGKVQKQSQKISVAGLTNPLKIGRIKA